jgi:dihydropyrimidinase
VTVISRGRIVVDAGTLHAQRGSGEFLPCAKPETAQPLGRLGPELTLANRVNGQPLF